MNIEVQVKNGEEWIAVCKTSIRFLNDIMKSLHNQFKDKEFRPINENGEEEKYEKF